MPEVGEALLLMQGQRIVDLGTHSSSGEMLPQEVSVSNPDDVLVVDVAPLCFCRGVHRTSQVGTSKGFVVIRSVALATLSPAVQVLELHVQDGSLQFIHAEIAAN